MLENIEVYEEVATVHDDVKEGTPPTSSKVNNCKYKVQAQCSFENFTQLLTKLHFKYTAIL